MKIFIYALFTAALAVSIFVNIELAIKIKEPAPLPIQSPNQPNSTTRPQALPQSDNNSISRLGTMFANAAASAMPAVVIIQTANIAPANPVYGRQQPKTGQGSGFFIDNKGHILTNFHVVRGQNAFQVRLNDGRIFKGKIVGIDPASDLAVIKINTGDSTPFLKFAHPDKIKVGHWVLAIGSPFSLSQTVTSGIISHKGRKEVGMNLFENFIQTDAAVNPGNSGGPLINLDCEVVGVNDFIVSSPNSRGSIGLSFAISSELAQKVAAELIKYGEVKRSWIGVSPGMPTQKLLQRLQAKNGVIAMQIVKGGPADKGGLRPGDVITAINGTPIMKLRDLFILIGKEKPGATLKITIKRNGTEKYLKILTISRREAIPLIKR